MVQSMSTDRSLPGIRATDMRRQSTLARTVRATVSCLTAATVGLGPACGEGGFGPGGNDDDDVVLRVGLDPVAVAAEVAELRAEAVVLAATAPVGALHAESGVDATGEAHYTIPIEVSPGVGGMQPELSISYGSNSGDGTFGDRTSLTGLSGISRCSWTVIDDGAYRPVRFDDEDALCLDGDRLVLTHGQHGFAGAEYRTKSNPFARIVLDHDISFLGGTISVWTRDGRILTYGTTPASLWKGTTLGTQIPWRWNLVRQCDRWNNCIDYEYEHGAEAPTGPTEIRLTAIRYGGTGIPASRRAIELSWEDREDATSGWFHGVELRRTQVASAITIEGPFGEVVRRYEIEYQNDPFSDVTQMQYARVCDAAGVCLPQTTFTWSGNSGAGFSLEEWDNINGFDTTVAEEQAELLQSRHTLIGDFDGDGDDEMLFRSDDSQQPWLMWFSDIENDGAATQVLLPAFETTLPLGNEFIEQHLAALQNDPDLPEILTDNLHRFQPEFSGAVVDFDGDILDDVLIPMRGLPGGGGYDGDLHPYAEGFALGINDGGGEFYNIFVDDGSEEPIYQMVPADHDGDGFTDVWMCRGASYDDAQWVLAHHLGGDVAQLGFEYRSTGIQCSAHDELSMASVDGGPASLLVIPAYDGPGGDLVATEDRTAYSRLQFDLATDDAALVASGLPRDNYQRLHDLNCRNGVAIETYGGPIFGAGMGFDKHLDLNEDGLEDVLRFELASGDGIDQLPDILDGLGGTAWSEGLLCGDDDDLEHDAAIVPYYNTGAGYVRGNETYPLSGNAHANFWLNFVAAQVIDVSDDGKPDLLMPGRGPGTAWTVIGMRANGSFVDAGVNLPGGWPVYDDDETWREQIEAFLRARIFAIEGSAGWRPDLAFVGLIPDNAAAWPTGVNIYKLDGGDAFGRMEGAVDGLGATTEFEYESVYVPDSRAGWPMAPMRAGLWVTKSHTRTVAGGGNLTTSYAYWGAAVDRRGAGFLGFKYVTVTDSDVHHDDRVRTEYVQEYDPAVRGYPLRGRPRERVRYTGVDGPAGDDPNEHVERELWDWETRVLPVAGGATYFVFPRSHRETAYLFDAKQCEPELCSDYVTSEAYRDQTTTESRDDFAILTSSVKTSGSGPAAVLETTTMTQDEVVHDLDGWLLGRVGHVAVESCRAGDCNTRETNTSFDPVTGAITSSTVQPGDPVLALESVYWHDAHGNVQQVDQTDPAGWTRTTTTAWDPEGVFPLSSTNAVGHTAYLVHHGASGALLASVDPAGLTEKTSYDGVFRVVGTSVHGSPMGPDDGAPTTIVHAPSVGGPTGAVMLVQSTTLHGQRVTEYLGATTELRERRWYGMAAVPNGAPEEIAAGGEVFQRYEYDLRGVNDRISVPQRLGEQPVGWHSRTVDLLGRTTSTSAPGDTVLERREYFHDGVYDSTLVRTVTTKGGRELHHDVRIAADGLVTRETDALGTVTCFTHGPFGLLTSTRRNCEGRALRPESNTIYDALGHPTLQQDPALGARLSTWNAFGELISHTDGEEQITGYAYDAIGRMIGRNDADGAAVFTWDTERLGALTSTSSAEGVLRDYDYDDFGRQFRETTTMLSASGIDDYVMESTFGPGGRPETISYPTPDGEPAFTARLRYDAAGYLRTIADDAALGLQWILRTADPSAQPEWEAYGNGVETHRIYDEQRLWVEAIMTTGAPVAQNLEYTWSPEGELLRRDDHHVGQGEELGYDDLWRLTSARVSQGVVAFAPRIVEYDVLGNIRSITGSNAVGAYAYDDAGRMTIANGLEVIHDGTGNVTKHGTKGFTYTPFGKVRTIADSSGSLSFLYDADGSRVRRRDAAGDTITLGTLYERKVTAGGATVSSTCRIPAGDRVVAQVTFKANGPGWDTRVQYLHDDALGSTHVVSSSDAANPITEHASIAYDPWGRAREADDWTAWANTSLAGKPGIGFTGHRADLDLGLIDMGGRMYDPVIARFVGADPLVADPYQGQSYNRYSYVGNRPFRYTDPTGWAAEPGQGGGAHFQADSNEDFYSWAIDWANSQAARWSSSLINHYDDDPNPIFAEDFGAIRDEAFRWAWAAGPGLVKRWAQAVVEQLETAIDMARMIAADPTAFGLAVASQALADFQADVSTLWHAYGRIKSAFDAGQYREAVGIWWEARGAAYNIAAIFVGGSVAAAGKVARTMRGGMALGRRMRAAAAEGGAISRSAGAAESAFAVAERGGLHSGFLTNMRKVGPREWGRTSSSLQKRIEVHEGYLENPSAHVPGFHSLPAHKQQWYLKHWNTELKNFSEQQEIVHTLLNQSGGL